MIKKELKDILLSQNLGVLATIGEVYPYTSLVGYAFTDNLNHLLFTTLKQTRKYKNLKAYPQVSVLVNSATNCPEDFKNAAAITVLGEAQETTEEEREELMGLYLRRFPYLKDFTEDPSCVLIAVRVKKMILVTRFQEVREVDIS